MQDGPPAVTSGKPKENSPVIFPEPSSALLSFGQTSIFLTQFSSQPQTSSQQRVQPKQQSPSPTSKAHPQPAKPIPKQQSPSPSSTPRSQPGTGGKQSIGSRKPHPPSPSPWCFFTSEESSPFARPRSY